jgi:diadenosine tetraphosphate (Ap4A) HIT family hydrolase
MLNRSGALEPRKAGCGSTPASTVGATTATVVGTLSDGEKDFALSVREGFDKGAGAGGEPFLAHWHEIPREHEPSWQQGHEPLASQQVF